MHAFPHSDNPLVVRTDFSDDEGWARVCAAIETPVGDFQANVTLVDDREYEGLTVERVPEFLPETSNHTFIFLVDGETLTRPDSPVLTIDVFHEVGRSFRVVPSEMWSVENNLSLANLDWEDFANNVDADGVFRAFRE